MTDQLLGIRSQNKPVFGAFNMQELLISCQSPAETASIVIKINTIGSDAGYFDLRKAKILL